MAKIRYKKLPHQAIFHDDDESKILNLSGGFGSGKSYSLVMKILKLSRLNQNIPGGLLCPDYAEYRRDILPIFENIQDENRINFRYNQNEKWWIFPWTRSKLYIFTADKKIRGPNLGYGGINEVGLIEYVRFKEFLGRIRVKGATCPQIACVGTPEGVGAWTYEHFIETPRPNTRVIYADTRDNIHLDEGYIQLLKDNYDEKMLEAYLMGKYVNMNGRQFYYAFDRKLNTDTTIQQIEDQKIHVAIDFNVDNMSASLWNIHEGRNLAFGEIYIPENADTQRLCEALMARGVYPENSVLYPDPAGNARSTKGYSDVQILRNNGYFDIRFKSKTPHFRQRQLCVANLMSKGKVVANPTTCPRLIKDWEAVEQNIVDFSKVKTNPKLTHFSDGADYFLDYNNPLSGKKPSVTTERIR